MPPEVCAARPSAGVRDAPRYAASDAGQAARSAGIPRYWGGNQAQSPYRAASLAAASPEEAVGLCVGAPGVAVPDGEPLALDGDEADLRRALLRRRTGGALLIVATGEHRDRRQSEAAAKG